MADKTKEPRSGEERLERLLRWFKENQRTATIAGAAVVLVAAGVWFAITAGQRKAAFAARELTQARATADAGNLPLAANDLSRLISAYGGTPAAAEGTLLLAQIRLQQGQPELAVASLREFLAQGPRARFRAPALGLLGTALEQAGNVSEAAQAYRDAGAAAEYELLGLQYLMEAARAFTAVGDTTEAAALYERILNEHSEAPGLSEVKLRLGEIRRSDIAG